MITIRKSSDRGHADYGWLDTRHTFSFADYYDPQHMGFRDLRVINEDRVAPGQGFGRHPHRDMEIVSWVLEGGLAHEDSLGTGAVLRPGEVQRMSAGTGVIHSEFNASDAESLHFLQIWILPAETGIQPSYEQREFPLSGRSGRLRRIVSPEGEEAAVRINQDVVIYDGVLNEGDSTTHTLRTGRHAWIQVARGSVSLNGTTLERGDGAAISEETSLELTGLVPESEIMLFDLK